MKLHKSDKWYCPLSAYSVISFANYIMSLLVFTLHYISMSIQLLGGGCIHVYTAFITLNVLIVGHAECAECAHVTVLVWDRLG